MGFSSPAALLPFPPQDPKTPRSSLNPPAASAPSPLVSSRKSPNSAPSNATRNQLAPDDRPPLPRPSICSSPRQDETKRPARYRLRLSRPSPPLLIVRPSSSRLASPLLSHASYSPSRLLPPRSTLSSLLIFLSHASSLCPRQLAVRFTPFLLRKEANDMPWVYATHLESAMNIHFL